MTEPIPARVTRGAALLDERLPGWWREDAPRLVDLDRLDVGDCDACIAAQTTGEYFYDGALILCGNTSTAWRYGFDSGAPSLDRDEAEYEALTAEWRRLILARRAGAPS